MTQRPALRARRPNPLSGAGLDRLSHVRADAAALAARLDDVATVVVPLWQGKVATVGMPPRLHTATVPDLHDRAWLLGEADGTTYLAVELDDDDLASVDLPDDVRWAGLREIGANLEPLHAHLGATATALATWHRTHRFCGACGAETVSDWAGFRRHCEACGREHFPRTDPAVIMRVTFDDRILLARNPGWPAGFGSVLAGFVEPGESLEDAVAREIKEEVGLSVDDIDYHSSQPWPFPSSIMLGFTAEATGDELTLDPAEVGEAGWYTREEVRDGILALPGKVSIARHLIDDWLEDEDEDDDDD
ncbi:MAG TPA: NAD(+) diphosphatase [Acidimicrobiales bacterium]|nr:NAD(+) diphosphatase [Acidimicrobiales bacterium]